MRTAYEDQKSKLQEALSEVEETSQYKEAVSLCCILLFFKFFSLLKYDFINSMDACEDKLRP